MFNSFNSEEYTYTLLKDERNKQKKKHHKKSKTGKDEMLPGNSLASLCQHATEEKTLALNPNLLNEDISTPSFLKERSPDKVAVSVVCPEVKKNKEEDFVFFDSSQLKKGLSSEELLQRLTGADDPAVSATPPSGSGGSLLSSMRAQHAERSHVVQDSRIRSVVRQRQQGEGDGAAQKRVMITAAYKDWMVAREREGHYDLEAHKFSALDEDDDTEDSAEVKSVVAEELKRISDVCKQMGWDRTSPQAESVPSKPVSSTSVSHVSTVTSVTAPPSRAQLPITAAQERQIPGITTKECKVRVEEPQHNQEAETRSPDVLKNAKEEDWLDILYGRFSGENEDCSRDSHGEYSKLLLEFESAFGKTLKAVFMEHIAAKNVEILIAHK